MSLERRFETKCIIIIIIEGGSLAMRDTFVKRGRGSGPGLVFITDSVTSG